ncbi:MAG: helix-turn-helix domain-containing protein [Methylococcaceae bacterium]|nr:helix-turn-helix domain-containing protein [Methylococcaceae bacterium]MDP2391769.1 helix-turn-helix domain-containing protein [Methylococcaceae bacterium]MDP3020105.1 helix-turn-helix domain-containing protein [Methylococcaceae bacterium]MDP3391179.1 helix-turn-helix domain-containing protein [Methylococcaceae bacterium]MDP3932549.1 helix-turn-helix domain-containing protein [Methylococcaceae bacterium]
MKDYKQLTELQRYQVGALKKADKKQMEIASILGVLASTISREIKRNSRQRGYRPKQAHLKMLERRQAATKAIKMTPTLIALTEQKIRLEWGPEQVSGWLVTEQAIAMSHERIYQHVWADKRHGGNLYKHLRHSGNN